MKREYCSPIFNVIELENMSMLSSSSSSFVGKTSASSTQSAHFSNPSNVYSYLSQRQKLAAMNLMTVFGGFCSGTSQNLDKINHIMSVEGEKMGVTGTEVHAAMDSFSGMPDMVNTLRGSNRKTLENLFWAYYCIVAISKSALAVQVLLGVYKDWGITEQECLTILEGRTGRKAEDL